MFQLTYSDMEAQLQQSSTKDLPLLRVCVLRNITIEPIATYWQYGASLLGRRAELYFSSYDQIMQETLGSSQGLTAQTDCILVFTKLETLSPILSQRFLSAGPEGVSAEVNRIRDYIQTVLQGIRRQSAGMILWHGFERPTWPAMGAVDALKSEGQTRTIADLNRYLCDSLQQCGNAYFIDSDYVLARLGMDRYYDPRYWHIGKAPYSREALKEFAIEHFKFLRARLGRHRKCVVLDCDNVLWGGVAGEDGPGGIRLGTQFPGSIYREFQQQLATLHARGILLALCSKNNPEDVWEIFRSHPDMILKEEMIAASEINWDDKATNVRRIAQTLNIGLDSLVFVDDSPFETGLVHEALPEVEVIQLPEDRPLEFTRRLLADGLFDTLQWSAEDRTRGASYQAEASRQQWSQQFQDLESYWRSLEMEVDVRFADALTLPRIAQLLLKTNQFNLTTRRYAQTEVDAFSKRSDADVFTLNVKDRFGDAGLVGVSILFHDRSVSRIDTFLLSCRVLGRGIEDAFLACCLNRCQEQGAQRVRASYIPTVKNMQVKDFYLKQGFTRQDEVNGEVFFERDLAGPISAPSHFKTIQRASKTPAAKERL